MSRFIARRFFGKLRFDLAHLGQTQHASDAGWINAVFRRQNDGDEKGNRDSQRDDRRAKKPFRCRQVAGLGRFGVVHRRKSLQAEVETAQPVS